MGFNKEFKIKNTKILHYRLINYSVGSCIITTLAQQLSKAATQISYDIANDLNKLSLQALMH
ncbi:hypothetical protein bpSLO_001138 (plasmid) [Borrelia parkeri]|nr:hypothetical protein [Borrelia parkeri]UPA11287.1 hypothetical protein bpSLO_001138 [Borrelia parkeri]